MKNEEIFKHWQDWAKTYKQDLRATTKTPTAKILELDVLKRRLETLLLQAPVASLLEVGCGNGINCIHLAKHFSQIAIEGIDYVPEMIQAARDNLVTHGISAGHVHFSEGNVLELSKSTGLKKEYDLIFTDRCLINLNTFSLQREAITQIAAKIRLGGYFLMIENSATTYGLQNKYRELLGLSPRKPAEYNLFFNEGDLIPLFKELGLRLLDTEDFISLHDLVLYVLVPAMNNGAVDYEHPLVEIATKLNLAVSSSSPNAFGALGQNRLYVCQKTG